MEYNPQFTRGLHSDGLPLQPHCQSLCFLSTLLHFAHAQCWPWAHCHHWPFHTLTALFMCLVYDHLICFMWWTVTNVPCKSLPSLISRFNLFKNTKIKKMFFDCGLAFSLLKNVVSCEDNRLCFWEMLDSSHTYSRASVQSKGSREVKSGQLITRQTSKVPVFASYTSQGMWLSCYYTTIQNMTTRKWADRETGSPAVIDKLLTHN